MNVSRFNEEENRRRIKGAKGNALAVGLILIAAGLVIVGRNTGIVSGYLSNILISWPMLLVIVGGMLLSRRDITGGLIVAAVGAFFLIPRITEAGPEWFSMYKPVLLILVGVLIVLKVFLPGRQKSRHYNYKEPTRHTSGYVEANSVLGSYENIVLDEVFTGANISGVLGGTVLDLRHTSLPDGDTVIDINSVLAGLVLYVPSEWDVVSEIRAILGGVEDKRFGRGGGIVRDRRLILRGSVVLGGVEIKS